MPEIPKLSNSEFIAPVEPVDESDFDPQRQDESKRFEETLIDTESSETNEVSPKINSNVYAEQALQHVTEKMNSESELPQSNLDEKTAQQLADEIKRKMLEARLRTK